MYPPTVARQRLGRHIPAATNACNNRRIVGGIDFYSIRAYQNRRFGAVCIFPYCCWATAGQTCSRCKEELLEASSSVRSMSYQRKVGNYFLPELLVYTEFGARNRLSGRITSCQLFYDSNETRIKCYYYKTINDLNQINV
jgi:hypothetical protein